MYGPPSRCTAPPLYMWLMCGDWLHRSKEWPHNLFAAEVQNSRRAQVGGKPIAEVTTSGDLLPSVVATTTGDVKQFNHCSNRGVQLEAAKHMFMSKVCC